MASEVTCGADCGYCRLSGNGTYWEMGLRDPIIICCWYTNMRDGTMPVERAYCPKCGRPLGFTPDGEPTIGVSYAKLQEGLQRLLRYVNRQGATLNAEPKSQIGEETV